MLDYTALFLQSATRFGVLAFQRRFFMNQVQPVKFATTRWSIVNAAKDPTSGSSRDARHELCTAYWTPLYAFARRKGLSTADAEDLTQAFFATLLADNWLEPVDQQRGKFRTYLLTLFKRFMAAQWRKDTTLARGGNVAIHSLQFAFGDAEQAFLAEPSCGNSAEQTFQYQWALTVLDRVWMRLRARYEARQQQDLADLLRPLLTSVPDEQTLQDLAGSTGKSVATLRVALHRLRTRYREILHDEVAETLDDPGEVRAELSELLEALRSQAVSS